MIQATINLFFPKVCYSCNNHLSDNERYICTTCRHDLPVTNFHFNSDKSVESVFYGRVNIEHATALLRFEKKGITQKLIHNLKYKGYEDIGVFLGRWLGEELKTVPEYQDIDIVIPVPLHKKRLRKRGFNQVAKFGEEIANALHAEYIDTILVKITNTASQVNKKRFARWTNTQELFAIKNEVLITNKHILLVDDIITTGATLEACINVLNHVKDVKISVATMAIA